MPTIREIAGLPDTPAKLSESALIMIDCQNTYRDGLMQLEGVEDALRNASQLLQRARQSGIPIFHIGIKGIKENNWIIIMNSGKNWYPAPEP